MHDPQLTAPWLLEIGTDIHGLLRWELRDEGTDCVLAFANSFPTSGQHAAVDEYLDGWHIHLGHFVEAPGRLVNWPT